MLLEAEINDSYVKLIESKLSDEMEDTLLIEKAKLLVAEEKKTDDKQSFPQSRTLKIGRAQYIEEVREECYRILGENIGNEKGYVNSLPNIITSNRTPISYSFDSANATMEDIDCNNELFPYDNSLSEKNVTSNFYPEDIEQSGIIDAEMFERTERDTKREEAAFRSLFLRFICAIILFGVVFAMDKLKLTMGGISSEVIEFYVTGNDKFVQLEEFFASLLRK